MESSSAQLAPLVPKWLRVAVFCGAAMLVLAIASMHERWAVDELPQARSTERKTRREFEVPAGASAAEELQVLEAELEALGRRERQRAKSRESLERTSAQVDAASYPENGEKLLEERLRKLDEAEARDAARKRELEARIAELRRG